MSLNSGVKAILKKLSPRPFWDRGSRVCKYGKSFKSVGVNAKIPGPDVSIHPLFVP